MKTHLPIHTCPMAIGSSFIYHDTEYNLYYVFKRLYPVVEIDLNVTRDIKSHRIIFSRLHTGEYVTLEGIHIKVYTACSAIFYNEWYDSQPYLPVFIRENGIPANLSVQLSEEVTRLIFGTEPVTEPQQMYISTPTTRLREQPPKPPPPKAHISAIVLKDAITENKICSITHDPITLSSTCVSPCYHCFTTDAIKTWLLTNITCPECREIISI